MQYNKQEGAINPLLISNILTGVLAIALGGVMVWALINYNDQKNNTDAKISNAVATAEKTQADELEAVFAEREKQPTRTFTGPDDLGKVTFQYPKTWSVYVGSSTASKYEAYLYPYVVPTVSTSQSFATRVEVQPKSYEDVVESYKARVQKGELRSSPITVSQFQGVRLDGTFSDSRAGTSVVLKIRDKALIVSTDAATFKDDFENIILKSLTFNP